MAPIGDLLELADAAERLATWVEDRDRARLLEIACELRRRAERREKRWFWMVGAKKAPAHVSDLLIDEDWQDSDRVRFTIATATSEAPLEAPRSMLPRLVGKLVRLSQGN